MKKLSLLLLTLTVCFFTACHKDIWAELENLDQRVTKLEELCKEMNTNITSLQTIVSVLQSNDFITGIVEIKKNGEVIGYTITFGKHDPITIYHGQDGKDGENGQNGADGKDGSTPVIGVAQDTDGVYYWTLNGEWLLDDNGNKLPVSGKDGQNGTNGSNGQDGTDGKDGQDGEDGTDGADGQDGKDGKDGITPQLKIEDGYWYISYDNGATWTQLGKATGEDGKDGTDGEDGKDGQNGVDGKDGQDGDSMFLSVTQDENYVYFTLADGTVIKIAKGNGNNLPEGNAVEIIDGAIIAAFSVSEKKQVYFSKGNLQFNAVQGSHQCADGTIQQGTWRFADKQMLFIGKTNTEASSLYGGWIDLFCWGTSGWDSGAKEYLPYSNPTDASANTNKNYYVGNTVSADLTGEYIFADWGVYNAISNGGNLPNQWRTLSKDEWIYLLTKRTYANLLNINIVVAGMGGKMLLPDNFYDYWESVSDIADKIEFNPSEWLRMEKVGAVFLPNAGEVQGKSYRSNSNDYWTSSVSTTKSLWWSETTYGAYTNTYRVDKGLGDNYCRAMRYSVRLVKDIE